MSKTTATKNGENILDKGPGKTHIENSEDSLLGKSQGKTSLEEKYDNLLENSETVSANDLLNLAATTKNELGVTYEKRLCDELRLVQSLVPLRLVKSLVPLDQLPPTLKRFQQLSDELARYIVKSAKQRIIAASKKGHGWTNIYQYLPTNHPEGIAQLMPLLNSNTSQSDERTLKFFCGFSNDDLPIVPTSHQDPVPIILLIQGLLSSPKSRNLRLIRTKGLRPVMDQVDGYFRKYFPGVRIVHRWVGKNGYIIEAVWDHEGWTKNLPFVMQNQIYYRK
jgi:hypothetical protein